MKSMYHPDIVGCYLYPITKYGYPPDPGGALDHLEELRRLGFRSIELEGIRDAHLQGIFLQRAEIRRKADSLGLKIPVFCVVLPGLSSPDDAERERSLELFGKGCEVAQALGAEAVLDNAPIPPWQFPGDIPITRHYDEEVLARATLPAGLEWDRYWGGLVETFRHVCDLAANRGMTYQVHPAHGALVSTTDAFLHFAEAVKRTNLRFNLDTANQYFLRDNLPLSLVRLKGLIDYIHVSDNRGHRVEHLAIGQGTIDWEAFGEMLDRTGYAGRFGLDIGGAESEVEDLDRAYRESAGWIESNWIGKRNGSTVPGHG